MKIVKALIGTLSTFGFAGFLVWIGNRGTLGLILLLTIVFLMVFLGMYCIFDK